MTALLARVVDFETTGLPEENAVVCEVGYLDVSLVDPGFPVLLNSARQSLIDPGVPMRPEISAIHHLVDDDFIGVQSVWRTAEAALGLGMTDTDPYVAHGAKFEQHFFPGEPHPWIDTYKCALRAWPDAPGHGNQTLRYWLEAQGKIKVNRELAFPPHRAMPDAYVTAHIFSALMQIGRPLQRLIDLSAMPAFLPVIRFGKHSGTKFSEIPHDYLEWMVSQKDMDEDAVATARYWLDKATA